MLKIRPVSVVDIDLILPIEESSFTAPFTREMFLGMTHVQTPFGGIAAELDGVLAGYLFYSTVLDEMEILTIAVSNVFRRQGIARALIKSAIDLANNSHIKTMFLEVRPSNAAARSLYLSFGFVEFGIRKGYYKDNDEDAITMKKLLNV